MKSFFKINFILLLTFFVYNSGISLPLNPFINSVSPSMNAVSVNKSLNIVIVFTHNMNPETVNNSNIKIFGFQTGLLSTSISFNEATKTATIDPSNDFKTGEIMNVSLTAGLQTALNGNITPFVYTFITKVTDGTGTFFKASSIDDLTGAVIKTGDIDADGNIDLIVNNKIYKNDGSANFTYYMTLNMQGNPELGDFDNDGDLDILIDDYNNNNLYLYKNNGSGVFTPPSTFSGGVKQIGDLNGDGYLDISYFVSAFDIATLLNVNGIFTMDTTMHFGAACQHSEERTDNILINDMDNDGDMDVVAVSFTSSGGPMIYFLCRYFNKLTNIGTGEFIGQSMYADQFQGFGFPLLFLDSRAFDFNSDGYIDILSPGKKLINNGNSTFSPVNSFTFVNSQAADFNWDGKIDVASNELVSSLVTRLNDGKGNFIQSMTSPGSFFVGSSSGDFDNDGDVDIAVLDFNAHHVSILLNVNDVSPIELLSFTSAVSSRNVTLNWSTASEENNSGFDIERRYTRRETQDAWIKVGFVNGSGTSSSPNDYTFTDKGLNTGKYKYRLKQIDYNGNFEYHDLQNEIEIGIPDKFSLSQNYPNPFNPATKINYDIPANGVVTLRIYDVNGKEVKTIVNEFKNAGYYTAEFDGGNLSSGVYLYKLSFNNFVEFKKMTLLK